MQIQGQNAVRTGMGYEIGHEFGRDRRARSRFAILTRIAVIGQDGRDAAGGRPAHGVDQDQQFHEVVIGRKGRGLEDEHILAAHVLVDLHENFLVGELLDRRVGQRNFEIVGNGLGHGEV